MQHEIGNIAAAAYGIHCFDCCQESYIDPPLRQQVVTQHSVPLGIASVRAAVRTASKVTGRAFLFMGEALTCSVNMHRNV